MRFWESAGGLRISSPLLPGEIPASPIVLPTNHVANFLSRPLLSCQKSQTSGFSQHRFRAVSLDYPRRVCWPLVYLLGYGAVVYRSVRYFWAVGGSALRMSLTWSLSSS